MGFSLGARVILSCLQTLAESETNGKHPFQSRCVSNACGSCFDVCILLMFEPKQTLCPSNSSLSSFLRLKRKKKIKLYLWTYASRFELQGNLCLLWFSSSKILLNFISLAIVCLVFYNNHSLPRFSSAGLVERVVLLGAPIAIKDTNWEAARKVISCYLLWAYGDKISLVKGSISINWHVIFSS